MIINGFCHTNMDGYETERWPRLFCCKPSIGDRVMAENGRILKVVGVTHRPAIDGLPYLEIELNR